MSRSFDRLTASNAKTLPVGRHTDPAQAGLLLQVRPLAGGALSRTWLFRFQRRGERTLMTLGPLEHMTLIQARDAAQAAHKTIEEGMDPRRTGPRKFPTATPLPLSSDVVGTDVRHTIDYLVSEYMERYVKVEHAPDSTWALDIINREILPAWKGRDARSIKPAEVVDLGNRIADRGSLAMANRTIGTVRQIFDFGLGQSLIDGNPVPRKHKPGGTESSVERCLSDDEVNVLLHNLAALKHDRIRHYVKLLLLTGQRMGELAKAKWDNVDLPGALWVIPLIDIKTRKTSKRVHKVPLSAAAVIEFEALKVLAGDSRYVMATKPGAKGPTAPKELGKCITRPYAQKRLAALGIAYWSANDLRRTCRTGLADTGTENRLAEKCVNHATDTYDKSHYLPEKQAAFDRWAVKVEALAAAEAKKLRPVPYVPVKE